MLNKNKPTVSDNLNIIWTITSKDIVDALNNRVVVTMIIMLSVILLIPRMLPLMFEKTHTSLPIYDKGNSILLADLRNIPDLSVQRIVTEKDFESILCGSIDPQIGLQLPVDFDKAMTAGGKIEFQGYVCWGMRNQVSDLRTDLEEILTGALDQPVTIHVEGNIVYPFSEGMLSFGLKTINSILMLLMMGVFLVPSLLFEEKESKTLQALLVSPATIGQVVLGKALAGFFYILVTAVMIYIIFWQDVTHWSMAVLFIISGGTFSVAVGLVLGSFFEKQQDVLGWMMAILLLLVGALLVKMLDLELPAFLDQILPWIPSVAIAEICRASFSEVIPVTKVLKNVWIILSISLPLYGLVIWKVRRSNR